MLVTWLVTNVQILSSKHLVSNIRHQHRCNRISLYIGFSTVRRQQYKRLHEVFQPSYRWFYVFIRWFQHSYHPYSWSGPFSISTKGSDVVTVCSFEFSIGDINLILNFCLASSSFLHQTLVSSVTESNWIPNSPSILLKTLFCICYQCINKIGLALKFWA